ncbi:hypothetical protein [Pluralibacter gergoviae]|uniref:hypothetical protein n=1 Tax=Pluralibacter gergoviae TaxID=61647 RepID=UPI00388E9C3E
MDIRTLLERIREVKDRLERANRIISICGTECRSAGVFAEGGSFTECYLKVDTSEIREIAENQKVHLESELLRLVEAKTTAERVLAGLLPETPKSA